MESFRRKLPGGTLQAVAVKVFAAQMDHHLFAGVEDRFAERHGAELRVAAGVVGDGDPVDLG